MANAEHIALLKEGVDTWNEWRKEHTSVEPDLSGAALKSARLDGANFGWVDLSTADVRGSSLFKANLRHSGLRGADLREVDLRDSDLQSAALCQTKLHGANLSNSNLRWTDLREADLREATLSGAQLGGANLYQANLNGANLYRARLPGANLTEADFSGVDLRWAHLHGALMVNTNFENANLKDCEVYGISAWDLRLEGAVQSDLVITREDQPTITVDNLEVAQFVYLLLNNERIRSIIDTIGEKGVLILGRFTKERKAVLDAIRDKLRELGFVPMMFDFQKPTQRDFTETIKTLAGMSRFIIADITNPKSSPLELQATMPDYMIPFVPIIHEDEEPFAMFRDLKQKYGDWVLDVLKYDSADNLLKVMDKAVVAPALKMADKLLLKKAEAIKTRHVSEYM